MIKKDESMSGQLNAISENEKLQSKEKLEIIDLHVSVKGKEIIKGVSLTFEPGRIYVLMGPNGAGKSTLANALMGNPNYQLNNGKIILNGKDITLESTDNRAKAGLFLSFQYPIEIPGIKLNNFLRTAVNNLQEKKYSVIEFQKRVEDKMRLLGIDLSFVKRYLNEGFSGGEKKKSEILQLMLLQPKYAFLDETDSGLDVDGIKIVAQGIAQARKENPQLCIIVITHYLKFLEYLHPDSVSILHQGKILKQGGASLAYDIEQHGFTKLLEESKL